MSEEEKRAIERAFMAEISSETKDYPLTKYGSEHGVLRQSSKLEGSGSAVTGEGGVVGAVGIPDPSPLVCRQGGIVTLF